MNTLSKLSLTVLALSLSNFAYAQDEVTSVKDLGTSSTSVQIDTPMQKPKATRITPELSLISSTFVGSDANDAKAITKISLGGTIDIGEGNLVTETGILFRQIGATETPTVNSKPMDVETDLNYMSVPITAKYYFSNQHDSSFFAKAGFAPSLLVGNKLINATQGPNFRNSDPNSFAVDGIVGLGGKYQFNSQIGLVLEVSYWRAATPVYSGSSVYTSNFVNTLGININL